MCVVSNIGGYGIGITPGWQWQYPNTIPQIPDQNPWNLPMIREYQKLVELAEKWDKKFGQPDCVDPEKAAFMKALEALADRLEKVEEKLDGQGGNLGQQGSSEEGR